MKNYNSKRDIPGEYFPMPKAIFRLELDAVYALPYARDYHPMYIEKGGVPAIEEVKFSLVSNRGCFGNCNFCALAFHQGRVVTARSHNSLIAEAEKITWDPDFKGYIHDVAALQQTSAVLPAKNSLSRVLVRTDSACGLQNAPIWM